MGRFLLKMERKFGKYAIKNLTLYLIIGYVIGLVASFVTVGADVSMMDFLTLNPYSILHGQVWRLFTWILYPSSSNLFFYMIMLFFYYSIGTTLERTWGSFRYNVFMFSGFIFSIIGAFILYGILISMNIGTVDGVVLIEQEVVKVWAGSYISSYFSAYYINLSIFLAFAMTYPNMQVMLYFVIPIKIKWLAYVDLALIGIDLLFGTWVSRVAIVASLLNVLIFYLSTRTMFRMSPGQMKMRRDFHRQMSQATAARTTDIQGRARAMHKCAICGRTELDNPNLSFRYCSKCVGNFEYCEEHLFTHEHKR